MKNQKRHHEINCCGVKLNKKAVSKHLAMVKVVRRAIKEFCRKS